MLNTLFFQRILGCPGVLFFILTFITSSSRASAIVPLRVAIMDTGVDFSHKRLKTIKFVNHGEIVGNSVDDDFNGFIDDINGWNFVAQLGILFDPTRLPDNYPELIDLLRLIDRYRKGEILSDYETRRIEQLRSDSKLRSALRKVGFFIHGSHVTGIASRGISGVDFIGMTIPLGGGDSRLLEWISTRYPQLLDDEPSDGVDSDSDTPSADVLAVESIREEIAAYFKSQKERSRLHYRLVSKYLAFAVPEFINCSWGVEETDLYSRFRGLFPNFSKDTIVFIVDQILTDYAEVLDTFIRRHPEILFVVAAGNSRQDNDLYRAYPAGLSNDNVLTVAASNAMGRLASFSNWGLHTVDVAAPGVGIQSSVPGNLRAPLSGTSQATPYVTNLAVRIKMTNPILSGRAIKLIITETVDSKVALAGQIKSGGVVNSNRALKAAAFSVKYGLDQAIKYAYAEVPAEKDRSVSGAGFIDGESARLIRELGVIQLIPKF